MSDDDTREIRAEEPAPTAELPTSEEPTAGTPAAGASAGLAAHVETSTAQAPTAQTSPVHAAPAAPLGAAAETGHIRVTSPVAPQPAAQHEPRPTLRVGTVVWGLVIAAIGVGLLSVAWGAHLDTQLALIVLLGAAGVALLVGSLVGMRRSRSRLEGRD